MDAEVKLEPVDIKEEDLDDYEHAEPLEDVSIIFRMHLVVMVYLVISQSLPRNHHHWSSRNRLLKFC